MSGALPLGVGSLPSSFPLVRGGGPGDDVSQPSRYFLQSPLWLELAHIVKLLPSGVLMKFQRAATVKTSLLEPYGALFSGLPSDLLHFEKSCPVGSFMTSCCKTKCLQSVVLPNLFYSFQSTITKKFWGISMCTCLQLQFPINYRSYSNKLTNFFNPQCQFSSTKY